jgi:hypothetical protein
MRERTRHTPRRGPEPEPISALERDLTRLADGTLPPERRELVERLLAGSPELQLRLREQRRAVAATRWVAQRDRAPVALRMRRRALTDRRPPRTLFIGLGLAGTVGTLAVALATLGGSQAGLTVAQAATIATRPAIVTVAQPRDGAVMLPRLREAGLPFPYWEDRFGWRATGVRRDEVDGRQLTTVFYRRGHQLIGYTIVGGAPLAPGASARTTTRAGLDLGSFSTAQRQVVTWLRRGHTCVLSGVDAPLDALLGLAVWRGSGRLPY